MGEIEATDDLFRQAVAAIDAGDVGRLERLLAEHPQLVHDRLNSPGGWLRDKVGDALEGFFRRPFLLWFVAEDPVRNGALPKNIAVVAQTIIRAIDRQHVDSRQEQLDYALRLTCWSWIARDCGVQIQLIDAFVDAGASLDGSALNDARYGTNCDAAIYNRNFAAAEYLVSRGASMTLTTALCLNRWADVERLVPQASPSELQDAFVQAALNGNVEALRKLLARGVDPSTTSARNQSHGTALHHAVWSGSLAAVQALVEAGADLTQRDTIYDGTPLGWASHAAQGQKDEVLEQKYRQIADYLRLHGAS